MNSGYFLIDCIGIDLLAAEEQTVSGIYEKCATASALGKPVYAGNLGYGSGKTLTPVAVMLLEEDEHTFVATASVLQIWITDADKVTIVNLAPAANNS